jgi:hypothetical protein
MGLYRLKSESLRNLKTGQILMGMMCRGLHGRTFLWVFERFLRVLKRVFAISEGCFVMMSSSGK